MLNATCRGCNCNLSIVQAVRGLCDDPECRRKDVNYQALKRRQTALTLIRERIQESWQSTLEIAVLPRNTKTLVPLPSPRIEDFRQHLEQIVKEVRKVPMEKSLHVKETTATTSGIAAEDAELPVLGAACGLCGGYCCATGGDTAWLESSTLQRLQWQNRPIAEARIVEHYLSFLPAVSYENSCIYHAETGCCLPRQIRSNVCNQYLCRGLGEVVNGLSGETGLCVAATIAGNTPTTIALVDAMGVLETLKLEPEQPNY